MSGRDPMQGFYSRRPASPATKSPDVRRKYQSLSMVATAFVVIGALVGGLGIIAVFVAAADQAQVDSDSAVLGAIVGILVVVLVAAFYIAMGQLINLMIDLQDNTHRTAVAVEDLDDTLDEIQAVIERQSGVSAG